MTFYCIWWSRIIPLPFVKEEVLSYRRETALQGELDLAKSVRLKLGDNISGTLQVYLQPL